MSSELPPLLALQAFEATARHESFTAAAEELNLSQSAVSHRVRSLERHLGYPLFERLPRGLRLTETAKAYLPSLRRAFEDILGSTSGVFGSRGKSFLTVRAPTTYASLWLATELDGFMTKYPHIEVHLTSSIWADKLAPGETDIDLRLGYGRWPGYEVEFLCRDALMAVCGGETKRHFGNDLGPGAIAQSPLVHVMSPEDHWALYFKKYDLARTGTHRDTRVDSSQSAARIASTSNRFALIQNRFVDHYVKTGELVIADNNDLEVEQAIYLLQPDTRSRRKPEAILFRDWLFETVK